MVGGQLWVLNTSASASGAGPVKRVEDEAQNLQGHDGRDVLGLLIRPNHGRVRLALRHATRASDTDARPWCRRRA